MAKVQGKTAKRYARALFDAITEGNLDISRLEVLQNALVEISQAWQSSAELRQVLVNPTIPDSARESILADLAKSTGATDEKLLNFLLVIFRNKRIAGIDEISKSFGGLVDEAKRLIALQITSAFPLSDGERKEVEQRLLSDFGSGARVEWLVNSEILGGLLIKSGDKLIDGSIKSALSKAQGELLA